MEPEVREGEDGLREVRSVSREDSALACESERCHIGRHDQTTWQECEQISTLDGGGITSTARAIALLWALASFLQEMRK